MREVSSFLLSPMSANVLISRSHVLWVLETLGQGFRLPIEDADSIQNVIELYRQWFLLFFSFFKYYILSLFLISGIIIILFINSSIGSKTPKNDHNQSIKIFNSIYK